VKPGDLIDFSVSMGPLLSVSGISFDLSYDTNVVRLISTASYKTGPFVSVNAFALWNSGAPGGDFLNQHGRISLGASAPSAWSGSGAVAKITFQVQPGIVRVTNSSIVLSNAQYSASGYDVSAFVPLGATVAPMTIPVPSINESAVSIASGQVRISFSASAGVRYTIEATTDFQTWTSLGAATIANGQATFSTTQNDPYAFYRVRADFQ
jgi:hypothetical protein